MFSRGEMGSQTPPVPERRAGEEGSEAADISRVDVHHTTAVRSLNAFNENIRSLLEVNFPAYGVARPSTLVSLSLHSNRMSSFEGFSAMTVSFACICLLAGPLLQHTRCYAVGSRKKSQVPRWPAHGRRTDTSAPPQRSAMIFYHRSLRL